MQQPRATPLNPARRQALRLLLGVGCAAPALVTEPTQAAGPRDLHVIIGPDSAPQRQILQALKQRYPSLVADADPAVYDSRRGSAVHVSIGPAALRRALSADLKGPLISVFTSSQTYRQLMAQPPGSERSGVTAIYADAAPHDQLQLIAALFERRVTVGVLLSDASAYLERPLRQAAGQIGVDLLIERLHPLADEVRADVVRSLTRLTGAQVLLAVPDGTLYTPETLRAVLESTYRRGLPVVGFSSATVAAGTLATAYPSVNDVATDLIELLDSLGGNAQAALPEPRYPRYWRVTVNENVARSLGINFSDRVLALGNPAAGKQE